MTLVLAAHGTRDPRGVATVETIAARLRARLPATRVVAAYVDVCRPTVTESVRNIAGRVVVVPAFLASGYHVHTDIPKQIVASGHQDVVLADAVGAAPAVIASMHDRLVRAGWRRGDRVVLAAAGSSDRHALGEAHGAARWLGARLGVPVRVGYVAMAHPAIGDAVAAVRQPGRRVAVASWLLAPGVFHRTAAETGAEIVAAPIGTHTGLVNALCRRYLAACSYPNAQRLAVSSSWCTPGVSIG